jgi:hypothetical protein
MDPKARKLGLVASSILPFMDRQESDKAVKWGEILGSARCQNLISLDAPVVLLQSLLANDAVLFRVLSTTARYSMSCKA